MAIVGLGYVGLPTGLALHESGVRVVGVDTSASRLAAIREVAVDLTPQDRKRLRAALDDDAFRLTTDAAALRDADAVMICVPTPVDEHLDPDLAILRSACATVVAGAVSGQTIILSSTSYPGSARELLAMPLVERGFVPGHDIFVASSPERIDPGNVAYPHWTVPRIVGGITRECGRRAAEVLRRLTPDVHLVSSPETAEMTKLLENSFRAVNIALANEIADAARALGLDPREVIDAAATKPYGFMPFFPGAGVGGHCIPCDPHYLLWHLRAGRIPAPVLTVAMAAIATRPGRVAAQIRETLSETGRGVLGSGILVVGVAYKPGVKDVRGSPGVAILLELLENGARVDYFDPYVPSLALDSRRVILSVGQPEAASYDLVLVNTLHPDIDYAWLGSSRLVVDPSGRYHAARGTRPMPVIDPDEDAAPTPLPVAEESQLTVPEQLQHTAAEPLQRAVVQARAFTNGT